MLIPAYAAPVGFNNLLLLQFNITTFRWIDLHKRSMLRVLLISTLC